jgi:putative tributyrin esterase
MAFATINYFSRSLLKASAFNIVFPDDARFPGTGRYFISL